MTTFLRRLATRAGVSGEGERSPVPPGAVRPRPSARFEPATAGPPPDEASATHEPVAVQPPSRRREVAWPGPPVYRGVLVAPADDDVAPPVPAPGGAAGPPPAPRLPAPAGSTPRGDGAEVGSAARRRPEPARPAPVAARPVCPPGGESAAARPPAPPAPAPRPVPVPGPDRSQAGRQASPPRPAPAPVPVQPARPASPPAVVRARARQEAADRSTTSEPVVHVTIGRVEIRTAPPRPEGARTRRGPAEPSAASALEEYLAGRAGGR